MRFALLDDDSLIVVKDGLTHYYSTEEFAQLVKFIHRTLLRGAKQ